MGEHTLKTQRRFIRKQMRPYFAEMATEEWLRYVFKPRPWFVPGRLWMLGMRVFVNVPAGGKEAVEPKQDTNEDTQEA